MLDRERHVHKDLPVAPVFTADSCGVAHMAGVAYLATAASRHTTNARRRIRDDCRFDAADEPLVDSSFRDDPLRLRLSGHRLQRVGPKPFPAYRIA